MLRADHAAQEVIIAQGLARSAVLGEIRRRAAAMGTPVSVVPRPELDRMARGLNHQGVVAITETYRYRRLEQLLAGPASALVFLDGVTDPHNLGSLLRSADGAGFDGVVIPAQRSAPVTSAVRRVAAGAAEVVGVARVNNLGRALDQARRAGLWVLGLDASAEETIWTSPLAEPPVAMVLGSEDRGISRGVLKRCDGLVRIPCGGKLDSLNVAVAGAVAMFEIARRRSSSATL
jgi:23S rRNA (guanosine2251-2'-O)-methyltransferase